MLSQGTNDHLTDFEAEPEEGICNTVKYQVDSAFDNYKDAEM